MKPPPPPEECVPTKLRFKVATREDLWRVCLKAPGATAAIPELEFEVGPDSKRHIDSVYNHVAAAIFNLTAHLRTNRGAMADDQMVSESGPTPYPLPYLVAAVCSLRTPLSQWQW